jgi:hypothetical protein
MSLCSILTNTTQTLFSIFYYIPPHFSCIFFYVLMGQAWLAKEIFGFPISLCPCVTIYSIPTGTTQRRFLQFLLVAVLLHSFSTPQLGGMNGQLHAHGYFTSGKAPHLPTEKVWPSMSSCFLWGRDETHHVSLAIHPVSWSQFRYIFIAFRNEASGDLDWYILREAST